MELEKLRVWLVLRGGRDGGRERELIVNSYAYMSFEREGGRDTYVYHLYQYS